MMLRGCENVHVHEVVYFRARVRARARNVFSRGTHKITKTHYSVNRFEYSFIQHISGTFSPG